MRVVIVGGGEVGSLIAEALHRTHGVTVIDLDPVPGETQRAVLEVVGPIFVPVVVTLGTAGSPPHPAKMADAAITAIHTTHLLRFGCVAHLCI